MASRVEVDLPWDLEELRFTDTNGDHGMSVLTQIIWLWDSNIQEDEEEYGRIFLAAGLLKAKFPDRHIRECLEQAIIWERG